jgi:hypothetical protein
MAVRRKKGPVEVDLTLRDIVVNCSATDCMQTSTHSLPGSGLASEVTGMIFREA